MTVARGARREETLKTRTLSQQLVLLGAKCRSLIDKNGALSRYSPRATVNNDS